MALRPRVELVRGYEAYLAYKVTREDVVRLDVYRSGELTEFVLWIAARAPRFGSWTWAELLDLIKTHGQGIPADAELVGINADAALPVADVVKPVQSYLADPDRDHYVRIDDPDPDIWWPDELVISTEAHIVEFIFHWYRDHD